MIANNYHAMLFIQDMREEKLDPENIFELQRILVSKTLDDETGAGRFRRRDENIVVVDPNDGVVLHVPPDANELPGRLANFCQIANAEDGEIFLHPVIMGILLHFALAYDHPFIDGNGRTARAIFYWYMARRGYWLMEYLSISNILMQSPAQYARSYLYSETDDNDLTYFITFQLRVIQKAIEKLHRSLDRKMDQVHETELLLKRNQNLFASLNHRQVALLNHGLRNEGVNYSLKTHKNSNSISYETARKDLLKMVELKLLEKFKIGRAFFFRLPRDLKKNIMKIDL
ncbi:MAG: Fic family protein [Candidatus Marinimicrobia bacterium]|nr:Fic family protein [Candidatus Neomarinimicrobiota bacterium]